MRDRLAIALASTALVVALFGATPIGSAARNVITAVPPFAKRADFATRAGLAQHAKLADVATNAKLVVGHRISTAPKPGDIPVVGSDGKLPAALGAVGAPGPPGPQGAGGSPGSCARMPTSSPTARSTNPRGVRASSAHASAAQPCASSSTRRSTLCGPSHRSRPTSRGTSPRGRMETSPTWPSSTEVAPERMRFTCTPGPTVEDKTAARPSAPPAPSSSSCRKAPRDCGACPAGEG